jgi:hypothetical protein
MNSKQGVKMWIGLTWLETEANGGRQSTFAFNKTWALLTTFFVLYFIHLPFLPSIKHLRALKSHYVLMDGSPLVFT